MTKDATIFLSHILDSIALVERYTKGKSKKEFFASEELQDAVIRRFEIIGEAARNLPVRFRAKNKQVPWRDAMDMRNALIHEYFGVILEVVWDAIKIDLPKFKKQIEKIIESSEQRPLV